MKIEYMKLKDIEKWPDNPKEHATPEIIASIKRWGFLKPLLIDETSGKLVAGQGRLDALQQMKTAGKSPPANIDAVDGDWEVPTLRGEFKNDEEAEAFLLTDNRLTEIGGWNHKLLKQMMERTKPIGFSKEAVKETTNKIKKQMDASLSPINPPTPKEPLKSKVSPDFDQIPDQLKGVMELKEDAIFPGDNIYDIPDLREDMLLEELPTPLDTWGDRMSTPDNGKMHWFFNHGAVPSSGLPFDRTIISLFTWDKSIETWWANPAYQTGKAINAGIIAIVVPDFSIWNGGPRILQMYSVYRAQWMGRYFQEAGVKIIPRLEYFCDTAKDFSLMGIPKNAPILAMQMHTAIQEEDIPLLQDDLKEAIDILTPETLLVYASVKGRTLVEGCKLSCNTVILPTASMKRKRFKKQAEKDPVLLELRKRKRGREHAHVTSPTAR